MNVKIHNGPHGRVVAICDAELLGKKLTEGKISLTISERFYGGEEKTEKELIEIIKSDDVLNIIGEKSCDFAIKHKLIDKEHIKRIQGTPHAQSF